MRCGLAWKEGGGSINGWIIWLCAFVIAASSPSSHAQNKSPARGKPQAAEVGDAEPKLDIQVGPSDKFRTISGGFDVYVSVTNPSKVAIRTDALHVCLPGAVVNVVGVALEKAYGSPTVSPLPKNDAAGGGDPAKAAAAPSVCWRPGHRFNDPTIPPGRQGSFHLSVPKTAFSWDEIFFRRDTYPIQFFYDYTPEGTEQVQVVREHKPIEFRPGLMSPLAGVVAGTLLISLFIALRREGAKFGDALRKGKPRELSLAVMDFGWTALVTWISGFISGLILVVVLNQTDTQQLPVTVSINDFWGGAFLGLVAYKLADWLEEKFFADASKKLPEKKPATTP